MKRVDVRSWAEQRDSTRVPGWVVVVVIALLAAFGAWLTAQANHEANQRADVTETTTDAAVPISSQP